MFDCFECGYYKYADGGCQCDYTCPFIYDDPFCLAMEDYDESVS